MIISGGENIYSVEVERVIAEHPAVMDVAVIGIPDDRWGEAVMAVVALRPGTQASEQDIVSWSRERLATYKCPKTVYFIEELPAIRRARYASVNCGSRSGRTANE